MVSFSNLTWSGLWWSGDTILSLTVDPVVHHVISPLVNTTGAIVNATWERAAEPFREYSKQAEAFEELAHNKWTRLQHRHLAREVADIAVVPYLSLGGGALALASGFPPAQVFGMVGISIALCDPYTVISFATR